MKDHPHDEFFKYLFSILSAAKEFLHAFLPKDVLGCLDLETLSPDDTEYTTPELASVFSDKVYRCQLVDGKATGSQAAIAILLEHKSFSPPFPHFQLNEYRQRIWSTQVQGCTKPTMVLPVVLYHGQQKWKKKGLDEYFGNLPEPLRPFLGGFDYVLIDLSRHTDLELLKLRIGFLAYGLLTMKHSADKTYLAEQFVVIFERGEEFLKTESGRNFVEHLFVYYARISELGGENLKKKVTQNFSRKMQTATLSTYDQIKLEGELKGKREQAFTFAENLLLKLPKLSDQEIADLSGVPIKKIKTLRLKVDSKKTKAPKKTNNPAQN
jgi:predicted transposase/invertase (TIGR01784 family)